MKTILFYFLVSVKLITGQVLLDSVAVNTSFYGVFNKTFIEMYILNTSANDSLEFTLNFSLNKSSIVENLWLEIDGNLKKDTTVSRNAGTEIYRRIVGKRIDPAYLIKGYNGAYRLRVFPINKHQKKKIIIEYYSIVGRKTRNAWDRKLRMARRLRSKSRKTISANGGGLKWFISFRNRTPIKQSIVASSVQPQNTIVNLSKIKKSLDITLIKNKNTAKFNLSNTNIDKYNISFDYSHTNSIVKYFSDSLECYSSNLISNTKIILDKKLKIIDEHKIYSPNYVKTLITEKERYRDKALYFKRHNSECNPFLIDMVNYLNNKRKYNIKSLDIENFEFLLFYNDTLSSEKLVFTKKHSSDSLKSKNVVKIECPFLNKYFDYADIIYQSIANQIQKGYLTNDVAKIVVENDKQSSHILDDVLGKEVSNELFYPNHKGEPVFFIAVEKMPELIGGLKNLEAQLIYPNTNIIEDQRVFVKVKINNIGEEICSDIIQSDNKLLSQISSFILSQAKWKPGKQRRNNVTVSVSIPIVFYKDSLSLYKKRFDNKIYTIENRVFKTAIDNNNFALIENGFKYLSSKRIKFKSEEFYDLLFDNHSIINVVYKILYLSDIGELGITVSGNDITSNILITNY